MFVYQLVLLYLSCFHVFSCPNSCQLFWIIWCMHSTTLQKHDLFPQWHGVQCCWNHFWCKCTDEWTTTHSPKVSFSQYCTCLLLMTIYLVITPVFNHPTCPSYHCFMIFPCVWQFCVFKGSIIIHSRIWMTRLTFDEWHDSVYTCIVCFFFSLRAAM